MRLSAHTPLVFLDTETTGMHGSRDRIIEVAAIRYEDGAETGRLATLVNPGIRVPGFITAITGIAAADLADAPAFEDVAADLAALLEGAVLVAHNARFDHAFLKAAFQRAGIPLRVPTLCTVRLSRRLFPEQGRHRLDELAAAAGYDFSARHRALDDALALAAWWQHARAVRGAELVHEAASAVLARPSLPSDLDEETLDALPNGPGVYLFYGEDDELLYVGKSVRIRDRVRSHFAQDYSTSKELALTARTRRIAHEDTAGELGALLRESQLIKERMPTYNRLLRRTTALVALERLSDPSGYDRLALRRVTALSPEDTGRVVGFARGMRPARERLEGLVRSHLLCQHLTSGAKLTGSPCFAQTLGWCRGACIGGEDPASYNTRVERLCAEIGMRAWPHEGPVSVTETHPSGRFADEFVIDHWAVVERRRTDLVDGSVEVEACEPSLDLDAFRIIDRAITENLHSGQLT